MAKDLRWLGSALDDLKAMPSEVQRKTGFALREVQEGLKPVSAKPLKGFDGARVLEIVANYDSDTYRGVYTVQFEEAVYVLHCFMKKSKQGIKTPKQDLELIEARLKLAQKEHEEWLKQQKKK